MKTTRTKLPKVLKSDVVGLIAKHIKIVKEVRKKHKKGDYITWEEFIK